MLLARLIDTLLLLLQLGHSLLSAWLLVVGTCQAHGLDAHARAANTVPKLNAPDVNF